MATVARRSAPRTAKKSPRTPKPDDALRLLDPAEAAKAREGEQHVYGKRVKCVTDTRGFETPNNDARVRIVVDTSEGFIPLWAKNSTLRESVATTVTSTIRFSRASIAAIHAARWRLAAPIRLRFRAAESA